MYCCTYRNQCVNTKLSDKRCETYSFSSPLQRLSSGGRAMSACSQGINTMARCSAMSRKDILRHPGRPCPVDDFISSRLGVGVRNGEFDWIPADGKSMRLTFGARFVHESPKRTVQCDPHELCAGDLQVSFRSVTSQASITSFQRVGALVRNILSLFS